jgi:hypothetical protein
MNPKELCLRLAQSETEEQVIRLLKAAGHWDQSDAWQFYGGNENNFATIGNQQSRPDTALIEKIVNSVDAVMMAECLSRGGDPTGPDAPNSIASAQQIYFGIRDGKLSNLTPTERSNLAERICLVATGAKTNPCYSIIDKGEGQTPESMPHTLLSIGRSNKLRIPFVQGKFNMGGTGVFQFCGHNNLQLIISKRHPSISARANGGGSDQWGFTIVRRQDPSRGVRNSVYKYLSPGGKIMSFAANSLKLLPGDYPEALKRDLEWGTFVKLYEYQMTGLKTIVLFDLYNRLSLLMPAVALPVRLYERRKDYSGHTMETTLSGLTVRLDEDKRENLEDGFPTSARLTVQGQTMRTSIYAFKRGQSEKYSKDEGIVFTVNGQTHGELSRFFFARQAVRMDYLSDSILVIVDCSDFDGRAREDLFMNSRDRLRSGELRSLIERQLEDLLKNHQGLKDLREQRRREDVENRLEDSKPLAEVMESIVKKSPTLSRLFVQGVRLQYPFRLEKTRAAKNFEGKKFPTYFKIPNANGSGSRLMCPIDRKIRVLYRTDAENAYFTRDSDPGAFVVQLSENPLQDFALNLWNGTAYLTIGLPSSVHVGDVLSFISSLEDVSRVDPFVEGFQVEITQAVGPKNSRRSNGHKPPSDDAGDESDTTSHFDLPQVIEVHRNEWDHFRFDQETALVVKDSGPSGFMFLVNMDNIHLRTEQKVGGTIDARLLDARYKYGMVLVGIALLRDTMNVREQAVDGDDEIGGGLQMIKKVTRLLSPVLLPIIDGLGDLEIGEMSHTYSEE